MNKNFKEDSYQIDLINRSYRYHKRLLNEVENGVKAYDYMRVRASHNVVSHMNNVANDFTGKMKLIVDSEILGDKKGTKWYMEYFSTPSYYRTRKVAYRMFLENLEK